MRKSIFEIVAERYDVGMEISRIIAMAMKEKVLYVKKDFKHETLFDFVDNYCFKFWKHRGHCVDVVDYLETIEFNNLAEEAEENYEAFMTIIEIVYNFWKLADYRVDSPVLGLQTQGNYYHLKAVLDDNLDRFNHIAYEDIRNDAILIIENKPEVTSVAESIDEELSLDIVRYNHRALKGDLDEKKRILLAFAADLEPQRKPLAEIDNKLADDIFFMLNNLNIRHNNRSKNDKNYRKHVSNMKKATLEKWYDELYEMILLAYLNLANIDRKVKIKELKEKIIGN